MVLELFMSETLVLDQYHDMDQLIYYSLFFSSLVAKVFVQDMVNKTCFHVGLRPLQDS